MREEIAARLAEERIVAVVRAPSNDALVEVARALAAGGIPAVEVTMTVPGAIQGIARIAAELGDDVLLGVGSITKPEQVTRAVEAGARYCVSPILDPAMIAECRRLDVVSVPGCFTPTECFTAVAAGADFCKVFPADVGGAKYLKALLAPMPDLKLVPTGGVDLETVGDFLRAGATALAAGSALVEKQAIADGDWDRLRERARAFRAAVDAA